MSETNQEANNKYAKKYDNNFSRKFSFKTRIIDVFNRIWYTSDPVTLFIATGFEKTTEKEEFPQKLQHLLKSNDP